MKCPNCGETELIAFNRDNSESDYTCGNCNHGWDFDDIEEELRNV